jgi:hypothetical protein
MANIITREVGPSAKGDILTNAELDQNFLNINAELGQKVNSDDVRLSDARTPVAHDHDDTYYTKAEVDSLASSNGDNLKSHAVAMAIVFGG